LISLPNFLLYPVRSIRFFTQHLLRSPQKESRFRHRNSPKKRLFADVGSFVSCHRRMNPAI
jgi:hypothetical protein